MTIPRTRPHIADVVIKNLAIMGGKCYLMRPTVQPNKSPPDFDLFPKLKEPIR